MNDYYYFTIASNFILGFDKYARTYSKENIPMSSFSDKFFVLPLADKHIGLRKAKALLEKNNIANDFIIAIKTTLPEDVLKNDHPTGLGYYIPQNFIPISSVYKVKGEALEEIRIEDLCAFSHKIYLTSHDSYSKSTPRSVSVLPVKSGCQAKCSFCFSEYSVSENLEKGLLADDRLDKLLSFSKERGAVRATITGGGEPTLISNSSIMDLIRKISKYYRVITLISNGYIYTNMDEVEILKVFTEMHNYGLSTVSFSHHHYDALINTKIMNLEIDIEKVLKCLKTYSMGLNIRLICVLQKEGVSNSEAVSNYLDWAGGLGVTEICFKELYVSTSLESYYASYESNDFSYEHQVPLHIVIDFLILNNFKIVDILPWGSPIYSGYYNGNFFRIAAYTEPSTYWELSNKISRSWNIMSNGDCLASLEDKDSKIYLPGENNEL